MSSCVLHNAEKEECKAKGLYCFDPEPENYTECIALNCAYHIGVSAGIRKCADVVRKEVENFKGK